MDDLRRVERQPQRNHPAGGVADDVCALDAEVPQQGAAIVGLLGETERRSRRAAAGVAATMNIAPGDSGCSGPAPRITARKLPRSRHRGSGGPARRRPSQRIRAPLRQRAPAGS